MANLGKYLQSYLEQDNKQKDSKKNKKEVDENKNSEIAKLKLLELEKILKKCADNKIAGDGGEDTRTVVSPNPVQNDSGKTKQNIAPEEGCKQLMKELKELGYGKQANELKKKYGVKK